MMRLLEVTDDHVEELALTMRPEDAAEVYASGGYFPLEAVQACVEHSDYCRTIIVGSDLVAIYGVNVLDTQGVGVPWALTSCFIHKHRYTILRCSHALLDDLFRYHPRLLNAVDVRHTLAVKFLKWLGATVQPPVPFGQAGMPFSFFELRRQYV